jgi:hypothetical protein
MGDRGGPQKVVAVDYAIVERESSSS